MTTTPLKFPLLLFEWRKEEEGIPGVGNRILSTQAIVVIVDQVLIDEPGVDGDVISYETGHRTFDDGAVAADDMLQVDIRLISLVHH